MERQIREDKVLEFKALCMTKDILIQLPSVRLTALPIPDMVGWVNFEGEWYIAETDGRLTKLERRDLWEVFATTVKWPEEGSGVGWSVLVNGALNTYRDKLPQIFIK